jgi:uncharacterized RDD family membrane protein YckC
VTTGPRYARFARRLRGIMLDTIFGLTGMAVALLIAASSGNDNVSRAVGLVFVAVLLLYEPVLVSLTGGTLGHYLTNLRVVDDRGGNVSFLKALARMLIKGFLGWYSFVILMATRRNQAIHDLVTRSTVQVRDPAKASPGQYVTERIEPANTNMPSAGRRVVVILAYMLMSLVLRAVVMTAFTSQSCIQNTSYCSGAYKIIDVVMSVAWLFVIALVIGFGWKGKLFGARKA